MVEIGKMLRMYLLQIWSHLSDPGTEDAIYNSYAMQKFTGINFMTESVPDETTLCKFVLLALGVDRDTAVADNMETNRCRAAEIEALRQQHEGLEEDDPKRWEPLLIQYGVLSRFADAALDAILGRYGTWETYFFEEYGLDHNRLTALRKAYLD